MAWLKANYPIAFYAAMITFDNSKFTLYKQEAEAKGIKILGPHVNLSQSEAIIIDDYIRTGLSQVKGIGDAAIQIILENQPYTSINDFIERAAKGAVNKRIIETLINADCFEGLPIIFDDPSITEENKLFGLPPVYLNRGELFSWFKFYYDYKNQKAEKNYLLDKSQLPKHIQEDRQLIFEKDNTIVVPFSKLNEFGIYGSNKDKSFTEQDLEKLITTRKKAKGKLLKIQELNKLSPIFKPFINNYHTIQSNKLTNFQMYTNDILNNDGISFKYHPMSFGKGLTDTRTAFYNEPCKVGGLITEITAFDYARKDDQGNITEIVPLYRITIITPYDTIVQTFNKVTFEKYKNYFNIGNYICYTGTKNKRGSISFNPKNEIQFFRKIKDIIKEMNLYILSIERNKYTDNTDYLQPIRNEIEKLQIQLAKEKDEQDKQAVLNSAKKI